MQAHNDSSPAIPAPFDIDALGDLLRALIGEWGPNAVHVKLPTRWKDYSTKDLGRVRLEFTTERTIEIHVDYEGVHLNYTAKVNTSLPI